MVGFWRVRFLEFDLELATFLDTSSIIPELCSPQSNHIKISKDEVVDKIKNPVVKLVAYSYGELKKYMKGSAVAEKDTSNSVPSTVVVAMVEIVVVIVV